MKKVALRVLVRRQEPNCADCSSAVLRVAEILDRMSKPIFQISSDDVIETAKSIGIPREKINWRSVEKYIENYNFEGTYSVWDAIKDGLREGLNFPEDVSLAEAIDELDRKVREVARTCKISNSDLQKLIIVLRQNAGQDLGDFRNELRRTLEDYSRLSAHEYEERRPRRLDTVDYQGKRYVIDERLREFRFMEYGKPSEFVLFDSPQGREIMRHLRGEAHETEGGETGAALGTIAASAAATGLGSPELIPLAAPAGSATGSFAERELRKRIGKS